jgi:hypothetical protein
MKMMKIIGLCGSARSGKDTFFDCMKEVLKDEKAKCRRVAFADELKIDLDLFLMQKFKISAWTVNDKEKALIRPIMVSYGEAMREISKSYWINKVKAKVDKNFKSGITSVITDVRYENEVEFINRSENSKCLYIEREGIKPANKEEAENDPSLRKGSCDSLIWRTFGDEEIYKCKPIVKSCLRRLQLIEK